MSGEADQLAEKAYKNIGPYSRTLSIERLDRLGNERIDAAPKTKL